MAIASPFYHISSHIVVLTTWLQYHLHVFIVVRKMCPFSDSVSQKTDTFF